VAATDSAKPFPIPVHVIGPGSQIEEDTLEYMVMPSSMEVWRPPSLPDAGSGAQHAQACAALRRVCTWLEEARGRSGTRQLDVTMMPKADRALLNQVLGEGEVAARVDTPEGALTIQESVFAGVWRVVGAGRDLIEVGSAPALLTRQGPMSVVAIEALETMPATLPPDVMNAPAVLSELGEHLRRWQPGAPAQVINLTLLPLAPGDLPYLTERLGNSGVEVLSRGYGNCRVTRLAIPRAWQVVYYNSQDNVILNTIEVTDLPDAVRAAVEDLQDSAQRMAETLRWLESDA